MSWSDLDITGGTEGKAPAGFEEKLAALQETFPDPDAALRPFLEAALFNSALKCAELTSLLRFHRKLSQERRAMVRALIGVVWPGGAARRALVGAEMRARKAARKLLVTRLDAIRLCAKKCHLTRAQVRQLGAAQRALRMDICDVLKIVTLRPRVLRGLWKSPRPVYAWIGPTALAFAVMALLAWLAPQLPAWALFAVVMGIAAPGLYLVSTRLHIAPGVLRSARVRQHLAAVIANEPGGGAIGARLCELGVDTDTYAASTTYEDRERGVRVVTRDKRTLEGSIHFLTSSEEIANCIALRNFVSWTLPSYLADEAIQLADVYYKGSQKKLVHRAQVWMVAAEQAGAPVLVINSFEFNDPGAKHLDLLMEHSVRAVQELAARAGFARVYAGISDYGRSYLDRSFQQARPGAEVRKVHAPEAGYRYHFDAFGLRWRVSGGRPHRCYVYAAKRSLATRAYALIFGLLERAKGNRAKAAAFWDTVANTNNMWQLWERT